MKQITLEELLEAGCHFGHQVTRQNPKAREFVFEARDNIHIIDLAKTKEGLEEAGAFVKATAAKDGSTLLVVGTKRQAQPIVEEVLKQLHPADIFTVSKKWVGGMLTNYTALGRNYARLKELQEKITSDEWKTKYTKRELGLFEKEMQKLVEYYGGVFTMKKMPDAIFVIDTHTEDLAVKEARRMGIPVVGIVDTNADPDMVDYVIPANDDAVGSLQLIISYILGAWNEGKSVKSEEQSIRETQDKSAKSVEQSAKSKGESVKKEEPAAKKSSVAKIKEEKTTKKAVKKVSKKA